MLIQQKNDNDNPELLDIKGFVQIKQKDFAGAIQTYAHLFQLQPDNMATVKRLAGLFMKIGEKEKANQLLEMIHQIERNSA